MPVDLTSRLVLAATSAWAQVLRLSPYVAGGVLLATLLSQLDLPRHWGAQMHYSGPGVVLGAACLGGVSPLCTYGTVPVLVELLRAGASPGPALAFLVASSLLNPQLFIMVAGGLGLRMALTQVIGTLLLSLPAGLLAQRLRPDDFLNNLHPHEEMFSMAHLSGTRTESKTRPPRGLLGTLLPLGETVGLHFIIGVILAALLQTLIPPGWISWLLGDGHWYGVLLAGLMGVPFYACGGGAVPVVAGLLDRGMSSGAALAFFLAGPATRVTAIAALGTLLNRRALIVYVAYVVAGAALVGTVFNLVLG